MTVKSRYSSSIDFSDPIMSLSSLDDPPPPPPNPPSSSKRGNISTSKQPKRLDSESTARTSFTSSGTNSSDPGFIAVRDDAEPPSFSFSLLSEGGGVSIDYDEILADEKSTAEKSAFSIPVLSNSSEDKSSRNGLGMSDDKSSYLEMDNISPPPPPPGSPPNFSSKRSVRSNKSSYSSQSGGNRSQPSSRGQQSKKMAEFHTSEFSNVDFDLDGLRSGNNTTQFGTEKSIKSRQSVPKSLTSSSKDSKSRNSAAYKLSVDDIEENDSGSVETEVLRYGEVNESKPAAEKSKSLTSNTTSQKNLSVAEKRRRKAMAASSAAASDTSRSNGNGVLSKTVINDIETSKKKTAPKPGYPELVLETSEDEDDASDDEREDRAIRKSKKKKGGFFKKLFNKSPGRDRRGRSPEKERNKSSSPFRRRSKSQTRGISETALFPQDNRYSNNKKKSVTINSSAKNTENNARSSHLMKMESGVSYDPSYSKSMRKLDSDLSLDVSDEVSEVTNPTYGESVESGRASAAVTLVASNQLGTVMEEKRENDDFFGNWGRKGDINDFDSASKDPFEDPFYPNVGIPGIKLRQEKESTSYTRMPSFLERRKNQLKKEEDIRTRLQQSAEMERQAAEKAKERREGIAKAIEINSRRENLLDKLESKDLQSSILGSRTLSPKRSISPLKFKSHSRYEKINRIPSPERRRQRHAENRARSRNTYITSSVERTTFKAPAAFEKGTEGKPFKAPDAFVTAATFDHVKDPIQRAGMRLLSAAAIPIQTEIRRYLAKKERVDRKWAIVVVQAYFRRWNAELFMYRQLYCVTKIQSCFRGWIVRDTMRHKHYCASQIQRVCRGYLATMKVYEALYNITVVQSIVRRNAAIKAAETRYKSIVAIQSFFRGYKYRLELNELHRNATIIQKSWRGFSVQLHYQFDVVDIIIVQSIARMRICQKRYAAMLHKKRTDAALVIQKHWRSYDCTMNYLHSIADILIVQSVIRRWIAIRFVKRYREKRHYDSAVLIQKSWRGFKVYIDYIFTIADVVLVQKLARGWLAKRYAKEVKILRQEERIQNAALTIQKNWKSYRAQMNLLYNLVNIIIAQSVVRRRIAMVRFKPMLMEYRAATTIQCLWRVKSAIKYCHETRAAKKIQAVVKGWLTQCSYRDFLAARTIQSWYRCKSTRKGYLYYISARKIQTVWRGYDARKLAEEERWVREYAATMIQKNWRMFVQTVKYSTFLVERDAAIVIQKNWRSFWDYSHFVIMRYELIRIQAAVRGYQTRQRLQQEGEAAIILQTAARSMLAKKLCHSERVFNSLMRSAQLSFMYKHAATKIQRFYLNITQMKKEKQAALVIERFFIWVRSEVEREIERRESKKSKRQNEKSKSSEFDNSHPDSAFEKPIERKNYKSLSARVREISPSKQRSFRANQGFKATSANNQGFKATSENDNNNDESSVVSGLTAPSFHIKQKSSSNVDLDEELDNVFANSTRRSSTLNGVDYISSNSSSFRSQSELRARLSKSSLSQRDDYFN